MTNELKHTDNQSSVAGGSLMAIVGVLYLIFENKILSKTKLAGDSAAPAHNTLSRTLIGIQVWVNIVSLALY